MGNCCGKPESDNFAQPGRPLGSAPPEAPKTAPVPKKVGGPARTLGGAEPGASDPEDARRKAAEAAEARANSSTKGRGKLQTQLAAQRKQTRSATLEEASRQRLAARDAADAAEAGNWN